MAANMLAGATHAINLGIANMEGTYGVAMVKATNLDIVAPKEKHVRYLIQWTNENCSDEDLTAVFRCFSQRLEEPVITPADPCKPCHRSETLHYRSRVTTPLS